MCSCEDGVTCPRCKRDDWKFSPFRPDQQAEDEQAKYDRDRQRREDAPDA